jgi:methionyl aminopeptidase
MIRIKNEKQISGIRKSCHLLAKMFTELEPMVQPGIRTLEIDDFVRDWIKKIGGRPAFLGVHDEDQPPFPGAICISVNEEVIHGIPGKRKLQSGDLVSLDCGIDLDGYYSDQTITVEVGSVHPALKKLNAVTKESLRLGIEAIKPGARLQDIARAVSGCAAGYGIVYDFCGHGVGLDVHEDPSVFNVPNPNRPNPRLRAGMVLAIEPMINLGTAEVAIMPNDWTVVTADGKPACHWEHTVAVTKDGVEILTVPADN